MKKTSLFLLGFLIFFALIGPYFTGKTYYFIDLASKNLPPSYEFFFGSDDLGRDVFTRCCYGVRISLFVGFCAAFIDSLIGVTWGGISGYFGGRIEELMMRIADFGSSIPYLLIVILITVIFGPNLISIIIAMTITGWITIARIVKSEVSSLMQEEYIYASKTMGAGVCWILKKHLIPNLRSTILSTLTLTIPTAIFTEAFLSFLGLGVQAPIASLGSMASEGVPALEYFPWRVLFPLGFITLIIVSLNLLGDSFKKSC